MSKIQWEIAKGTIPNGTIQWEIAKGTIPKGKIQLGKCTWRNSKGKGLIKMPEGEV